MMIFQPVSYEISRGHIMSHQARTLLHNKYWEQKTRICHQHWTHVNSKCVWSSLLCPHWCRLVNCIKKHILDATVAWQWKIVSLQNRLDQSYLSNHLKKNGGVHRVPSTIGCSFLHYTHHTSTHSKGWLRFRRFLPQSSCLSACSKSSIPAVICLQLELPFEPLYD